MRKRGVVYMKVPKKYKCAIKEIYIDDDGIWCILNQGYVHGVDENSVIHCESYKELHYEFAEIMIGGGNYDRIRTAGRTIFTESKCNL